MTMTHLIYPFPTLRFLVNGVLTFSYLCRKSPILGHRLSEAPREKGHNPTSVTSALHLGRKCPRQDGGLGRKIGRPAEVELGVVA